jgi:hypothetical protein
VALLLPLGLQPRNYKMYKQLINRDGIIIDNVVVRTLDNACIPFDPENTDYQIYLVWVSKGNTPLEASK